MTKYLNITGLLIIILNLTCCKYVEFKPSHISLNINESKNKKAFICEYVVSKKTYNDSIDFNYNEIWLEKKWSNYLDKNGQEKFKVVDSTAQLVINFKDDHLFTKKKYWDKFIIKDDDGNVMGSDKGILSLDADILKNEPKVFKLFVIKVKDKYQPNLDTIRIGELLLKRQSPVSQRVQ